MGSEQQDCWGSSHERVILGAQKDKTQSPSEGNEPGDRNSVWT